MANINLNNLREVFINGKQLRTLFVRGKQINTGMNTVSFNTNMASGRYYYISGQSGTATTQAAPATRTVPIGGAIGVLPSTLTNKTYILNSVTYTISVTGWYTEQGLTNKVDAYWVPTSDCTLYAKWEMTADKTIAAAVTIPKFASGVSWSCYSNGGSRSAVTATCSGSNYAFAFTMAAPGAARNSDTYTWSNCGGKTITALSATSMTLNGVTRSVTTPSAGGSWTPTKFVFTDIVKCNETTGVAAGSKTWTSGNYKAIMSWPKGSSLSASYSVTIKFYYANAEKASMELCKYNLKENSKDETIFDLSAFDVGSNRNGTFASGNTYGAAGGWAVTRMSKGSQHNSSIAAASGTGASRTITVKK